VAISSPGIGSNLDVNSIVSQLMTVERQPLQALDKAEAAYQVKISAYGALRGALTSFESALARLKDAATFTSVKATVGDSSILSATTSQDAVPGSESIEVVQLAQCQRLASAGVASNSTVVGTGSLTIALGSYDSDANTFTPDAAKTPKTITIDSAHGSLTGIRDAINAADAGVAASIVNDGSANGYRLVLSSTGTGAKSSIRVTVGDEDGAATDAAGLSSLAYDPTAAVGSGKNLTQTQAAGDARLIVDGITFNKASNVVTDAIQGVTLTLLKTNQGAPTSLDLSRDATVPKGAVHDLVTAFNALASTIKKQGGYDASTKTAGPLEGDSALRSISSQIRAILGAASADPSTSFHALGELGIAFKKDGTLAIDDDKLSAALGSDSKSVASVFANTASKLGDLIDRVTGTQGVISAHTDGISASIKRIGQRRDELNRRLTRIEASYRAQFTALDTLVSKLTSTETFLTQQIANLPRIE
jgi:flagellar hook-associated protein 2